MALKLLKGKTETSFRLEKVSDSYKGKIHTMSAKAKIKVIKKDAIKAVEAAPALTENKVNQAAAAREMVSTVSNWVSDFQQKRRDETKHALELLFAVSPQTSGV